jgi:RHS repeat-associated protein
VAERLTSSQIVTSASIYDAYGVETSSISTSDPFGYNGRWGYYFDREIGLQNCRHRYYDPAAGRFLTRDPAAANGGVNLFGYARQHPGQLADPVGLGPADSYLEFLWGSLNELAGGIASLGGEVVGYDSESGSTIVEGGWFSNLTGNGMTSGDIINVPSGEYDRERLLSHERGHRLQSDCLGPSYLPATLAGYGIGILRGSPHDGSPLEMDADARSGNSDNIEGNPFVKGWIDENAPDPYPRIGSPDGSNPTPLQPPGEKWPPKREI